MACWLRQCVTIGFRLFESLLALAVLTFAILTLHGNFYLLSLIPFAVI